MILACVQTPPPLSNEGKGVCTQANMIYTCVNLYVVSITPRLLHHSSSRVGDVDPSSMANLSRVGWVICHLMTLLQVS